MLLSLHTDHSPVIQSSSSVVQTTESSKSLYDLAFFNSVTNNSLFVWMIQAHVSRSLEFGGVTQNGLTRLKVDSDTILQSSFTNLL